MSEAIPGVIHEQIARFSDERGFFSEIFRQDRSPHEFKQANHSHSAAGVIRGLHYHRHQADLWYVLAGDILVGLTDLRRKLDPPATSTIRMSADQPATLYIPPGVAHGFAAITDCDLIYWVTQEYDPRDEAGIAYDDALIAIDWRIADPVVSERDRANPGLDWDDIPSFS